MSYIIVVFVYCGGMEPDYNIFENAYMEDLNNTINPLVLASNYKTVDLKSKRDTTLVDWAIENQNKQAKGNKTKSEQI